MAKDNGNIPDITFSGDITVNGPMFDIHDNEHVHIERPVVETTNKEGGEAKVVEEERDEEQFHFIHPEIEDEEAWRIHKAIKRLVAHQKVPEICAYLKEKKQEGKLYLPPNPSFVYEELKRLGMPTGDGYSDKYFASCYKNITISKD